MVERMEQKSLSKEFILKGIVGEVTRERIWEKVLTANAKRPFSDYSARCYAQYLSETSKTPSLTMRCPQLGDKKNVFTDCKDCLSEPEICHLPSESKKVHKDLFEMLLSEKIIANHPSATVFCFKDLSEHYKICKECQAKFKNEHVLMNHFLEWAESDDAKEIRESSEFYRTNGLPLLRAAIQVDIAIAEAEQSFDAKRSGEKKDDV